MKQGTEDRRAVDGGGSQADLGVQVTAARREDEMKVTVERSSKVPCGYLLTAEDGRTVPVQMDWDFPGTASNLGFVPCECGDTDGTVDCAHKTASQMISEAAAFLDEHEGEEFDDPGYFD